MAFVAAWRLKATGSSGCYVSFELLSATLAVAAISALLAFHNIDFPFGVHPDEAIKVGFAFGQPDNYRHPPLLIVLARFAAWLDGAVHDRDFRLAGRTVCAFASVAASVLFISSCDDMRTSSTLSCGVAFLRRHRPSQSTRTTSKKTQFLFSRSA